MLKKSLFTGVLMALLPTVFLEAYRGLGSGLSPARTIVAVALLLLVIVAGWALAWWLNSHKRVLSTAGWFLAGAFSWVLIGIYYHQLFQRPGAIALGLAIFAAIYHWYPILTGRIMYAGLGVLHFWVTFIFAMVLIHPVADFWYRWQGYIDLVYVFFDYPAVWHFLKMALVAAQGVFVVNLVYSTVVRRKSVD